MSDSVLADIASAWNHLAKRFIEAPVYRLGGQLPPHPLANRWRLVMEQDGVRHVVESDQPILDSAPIWPHLRTGSWIQCSLLELDGTTGWCVRVHPLGARIEGTRVGLVNKAPDWEDHEDAPLDYAASLAANVDWFAHQEASPGAYYREPGMPAWWWHAAESDYPPARPYQEGAFPALASAALNANIYTARALPSHAEQCLTTARAVGDWLLRNRTPMSGALPGMPYSAMKEGAFAYSADGRAINLSRSAMPAFGMALLYQETGEEKYLDYAQHVAGVLTRFVRDDGSMPYRIRPDTGKVVENYTTGHVQVALLLEALDQVAPDARWREPAIRIRRWVCERPMRDFNWKACFEDVGKKAPFTNLSSMDALWAVRLLARHSSEDPTLLAQAGKLLRWVEDQFVNFGDDASLTVHTYYPTVREQYWCDFPMEVHSANYASSCWELYQATGDETFRRKVIATLNAIVRSQRPDGAYSTWGVDRETGFGSLGSGHNWFNCNNVAVSELSSFLLRERGETPLPF